MQRFMIGAQADGVAGMKAMCDLLEIGQDPQNDFKNYSEIAGQDLTSADIQAGLATDTLRWVVMPQKDYDRLFDLTGIVYVREVKETGTSGRDAANYIAVAHEPTFQRREGLVLYGVEMKLTGLEAV